MATLTLSVGPITKTYEFKQTDQKVMAALRESLERVDLDFDNENGDPAEVVSRSIGVMVSGLAGRVRRSRARRVTSVDFDRVGDV